MKKNLFCSPDVTIQDCHIPCKTRNFISSPFYLPRLSVLFNHGKLQYMAVEWNFFFFSCEKSILSQGYPSTYFMLYAAGAAGYSFVNDEGMFVVPFLSQYLFYFIVVLCIHTILRMAQITAIIISINLHHDLTFTLSYEL